jgi:hypothetical protein
MVTDADRAHFARIAAAEAELNRESTHAAALGRCKPPVGAQAAGAG